MGAGTWAHVVERTDTATRRALSRKYPFQDRSLIEAALEQGCDLVSMARPLLANPELISILREREQPENPCTFCNRCDLRTSLFPLGCYDVSRFNGNYSEMERQIIRTSGNPVWPHPKECIEQVCVEQVKGPSPRSK